MTLTEFLLARIAEDEAAALAATPGPWSYHPDDELVECAEPHPGSVGANAFGVDTSSTYVAQTSYDDQSWSRYNSDADGSHIARHDPARVLRECEAKRRIVEIHEPVEEWSQPICWGEVPVNGNEFDLAGEWPCDNLKLLALPYADHPDYDEAWRP